MKILNKDISHSLISFRDFYISYFYTKILGIVFYNNNYTLTNSSLSLLLINFMPYFIVKFIFSLLKINYLYQKDEIIYYSKSNKLKLSPVLLGVNIKKDNKVINIKDFYSKYDNNVPLQLIFKNEMFEINDEDEIVLKYLKDGKIIEKSFNYKIVKLYLKIDLLK